MDYGNGVCGELKGAPFTTSPVFHWREAHCEGAAVTLRLCGCGCQCGSWMVELENFLNKENYGKLKTSISEKIIGMLIAINC